MLVNFYKNTSENNAINKNIDIVTSKDCVIKSNISVMKPSLIVTYDGNIDEINYCYISEYGRYYYIDNITLMTGNRYSVECSVDVLMSFKDYIRNLDCIIDKAQNRSNANTYLNDGSFVTQSNEVHSIINFPNGFNDNGTFILICAGGDGV